MRTYLTRCCIAVNLEPEIDPKLRTKCISRPHSLEIFAKINFIALIRKLAFTPACVIVDNGRFRLPQ
jgi:hypothetical protein